MAALLAVLVCGGSLDWGHAGDDDSTCNALPASHDHAAHRVAATPGQPTAPADHCYICHSLRLLQTTLVERAARLDTSERATLLGPADRTAAADAARVALSSRAPPASSL